jgi:phage-related minor tail protein
MTVIGEAFVAITPETASFAANLQSKFQALNLGSMGAVAGVALAAGITAGLIKIGREFGAVKQQIQKETGQTGEALAHTFDTVKSVFADVPDSLGKITTAVDELARRGTPLGKTFDELAKQELALSHITGTDLAANVEQTTGVFKKFGVPLREQPALLDAMFKASQRSGKSFADIIGPLTASGTALQQFGFTAVESVALIGNIGASGADAGRSLTALKVAFGKIVKAGDDPKKVFAELNKEFASKNPHAMADALKVLGNRGIELASAMQKGTFNFDSFLKAITNGRGGLIATEESTRTLGEKISVMSHQFLLAVQPLASAFSGGLSQALTDLSGPFAALAQGAGHLVSSLSPLALVVGGTLVVAFRLMLPVITAFGQGLDAVGSALDLVPPQVLIALAAACGVAALGFEGLGTAIVTVGVAIDIALGPVGLAVIALGALGAVMSKFGKGAQQTKVDVSGLEDVFKVTKDSTESFADAMKSARAQTEDWVKSALSVSAAGTTGVDTLNKLGLSFDGVTNALTGNEATFQKFQNQMTTAAANTGLAGDKFGEFHDTITAGRATLENNALATVAAAQATGLLTDKQVAAAQAAATNTHMHDDYGHAIVDNIAVLNALTPAIEKATAAQNAQAEKTVAPKFGDLAGQFATGALSATNLASQLQSMGFTAEGAKAKVELLKGEVQQFSAAIDKAIPDVSAAAAGLKNDLGSVAEDVHKRQAFLVVQFQALAQGAGGHMSELRQAIATNIQGINADTAKLASNPDLNTFTNNLKAQAVNVSTFFGNLHKLVSEGFGTLARDLLDLGAQGGGNLAAGFASDKNKAAAANAAAKNVEHVKEAAKNQALKEFPQFEGIGKSMGDATARGLGKSDIAGGIRGQTPAITGAVRHAAAAMNAAAKFDFRAPVTTAVHEAANAIEKDHSLENAARSSARNAARFFASGGFDLTPPIKAGMQQAGKTVAADKSVANAVTSIGKGATAAFGGALALKDKASQGMRAAAGAVSASGAPQGAAAGAGAATGQAFVSGLVNGLSGSAAIGRVRSAATVLAGQAQAAANKKLGISSPSKVGIRIGQQFAQGISIGLLNGQTVVSSSATAVTDALAKQAGTVTSSISNLGTNASTIQTLRDYLDQLAKAATTTTGTLSASAQALQSFLSTATGALPSAASSLQSFLSAQSSAQATFTENLAAYHAATKLAAQDHAKLQAQTEKTANAFKVAAFIKTNFLDVAIAAHLPTEQIAAVQHAYDVAVGSFQRAAAGLKNITEALKEQRTAVHDAAKALGDASTALRAANDPDAFTKSLNQQTAKARAFTADISKLVKEGFVDLAKRLAEQGSDAAGKLADSFAKDSHKAKLANNAVKNATAYGDKFTKTLDALFGTSSAGETAGAAVGTNAGAALISEFDNSIKTLTDKLALVRLRLAPVAVDTSAAVKQVAAIPDGLSFVPEVGRLPDQIAAAVAGLPDVAVDVVPHLAALAALPPMTLDVDPVVPPLPAQTLRVTPLVAPVPPFDPMTVPVTPTVGAIAPQAIDVTPHLRALGALPPMVVDVTAHVAPLAPIPVEVLPRVHALTELPRMTLDVVTNVAPLPAMTVEVTPRLRALAALPPVTVDVTAKLEELAPLAPVTIEVTPHMRALAPLPPMTVEVDANLATALAPQSIEVTPHLLPLPKLDPITVDVIPRVTAAANAVASLPVTASAATVTGPPPSLNLDLTVVLEDGRTVNVRKVLPLPSSDLTQKITTQIHAS